MEAKAQFIAVCVEVGNDSTHSCVYNVSRCTAVVIHTKCSNHRLETSNSTVRGVVKPWVNFFVHGALRVHSSRALQILRTHAQLNILRNILNGTLHAN